MALRAQKKRYACATAGRKTRESRNAGKSVLWNIAVMKYTTKTPAAEREGNAAGHASYEGFFRINAGVVEKPTPERLI